jgi:hypothetical protein
MAKKKDDLIARSAVMAELAGVKHFMEKTFTRAELRADMEYNRIVRLLRWAKDLPASGLPDRTPDVEHRLLVVEGDVEPRLVANKFKRRAGVLNAARAYREMDPAKDDGLYHLAVDWKRRTVSVGCFSGGELDVEDRHGKNNG